MRQPVLTALVASAALLIAPSGFSGGPLPVDGDSWVYLGGTVEAVHVPSGEPATDGRVAAFYNPEGYRGRPAGVSVTLHSMRWPDPAIRPYLRHVPDHATRHVPVDEDGRFATELMTSRVVRGSYVWEPARLDGAFEDFGRVLRGTFESRLVRGSFEVRGMSRKRWKRTR